MTVRPIWAELQTFQCLTAVTEVVESWNATLHQNPTKQTSGTNRRNQE